MAPPPREKRSGPQSPGDRLTELDTAAAKQPESRSSLVIVRQGDRTRRYPRADASWYAPAPGRTRDWLSIRCPRCGGVHLARLRPGSEPGGRRRTPCGTVWVVVRRRYGTRAEAAA